MKTSALTLIILTTVSLLVAHQVGAVGNCVPDTNGYVECAKQCSTQHVCYGNSFPREYYCYTYIEPPGCYHDGQWEECCAPAHAF